MRLLSLCDGFLPNALGGVEVLSYHLLRALRARGHEVLVLTSRIGSETSGRHEYGGLELVKIKFNEALASRDLGTIQRTKKEIASLVGEFAPDVLHLNDARPSSFFFLRSGATGSLPRVLTLHSPIRAEGHDGLQHRLAIEADRVIAVSQAQQADAMTTMNAVRNKISVIHNALPVPAVVPTSVPFAPPLLLCVGRIVREKGFDVALRAVANLSVRGMKLDIVVAGNGSEKENLEALARECGISGQVRFLDWVAPEEVAPLMNSATLVLMPSRWQEPFGLVALQAAQMSRPVVASAVGGLTEIVVHGQTGLLIPPEDIEGWTHAVAQMLAAPAVTQQMGDNARHRALREFDFETLVTSHERVYLEAQQACGGTPHQFTVA